MKILDVVCFMIFCCGANWIQPPNQCVGYCSWWNIVGDLYHMFDCQSNVCCRLPGMSRDMFSCTLSMLWNILHGIITFQSRPLHVRVLFCCGHFIDHDIHHDWCLDTRLPGNLFHQHCYGIMVTLYLGNWSRRPLPWLPTDINIQCITFTHYMKHHIVWCTVELAATQLVCSTASSATSVCIVLLWSHCWWWYASLLVIGYSTARWWAVIGQSRACPEEQIFMQPLE